ncbi:PQQ-binding-like beta-propeller repeat protein [Vulgatibacter sp.]|uniref:outer membrane protein assembly factor BamB family protein n=1 Tax=Vulgatibacter sp. TaxID=1971226 RepID=UPI003564F3B3
MRKLFLLTILLSASLTSAACVDEDPPHAAGNAGGSAGSGGSGGTGGDPQPGWEGLAFHLTWRHQGFGEVGSLAVADFVGDGTAQIAVGARRPLLVSADGTRELWFADWEVDDNLLLGGDNDWVYELAAVPAGDGRSNLLVTSSIGDAFLLDGRDGSTIWRTFPQLRHTFPLFTTFETSAGLAFLPNYGSAAHSVQTGDELWQLPVAAVPAFVQTAARADALDGLFLVDEGVRVVGGPGAGRPGSLTSTTADGQLIFSFEFQDGDQPTALGSADLDGLGSDSAVVATWSRPLRAFDPAGELRWSRDLLLFGTEPDRTLVSHLLSHDLDGDGHDEVLAIARDAWAMDPTRTPTLVVALGADATERWRYAIEGTVTQAEIVLRDERPLLLLTTGVPDLGAPGTAVALQLGEGNAPRKLFRYEISAGIQTFAERDGTLVLGTADGILRALDGAGELSWSRYLSSFLSASAVVPMNDEDWVVTGDNSGNIALLDSTGARRWFQRLAVGAFGWTIDVTTARFERDEPLRIVAAAKAALPGASGIIERFSHEGIREASLPLPSEPVALTAADLDADGIDEILVVESARVGETTCHVRCYDADLTQMWSAPIELCMAGEITVADVDGDGAVEIAVRTDPGLYYAPSTLSLLERGGAVRWTLDEDEELSLWARAVPGGLLSGGATTERNGFAALRDAQTGEKLWKTLLPSKIDPANPEGETLPGASWFGHVIPGEDGFDLALTTYNNELVLLDGATGDIRWSVDTELEEYWPNLRRIGGPLVLVPGTASTPPHLVTAQYADTRRRADAVAVAMDGTIVGRVPMASEALRIHLLRRGEKPSVVAAQALLGVYAFGVKAEE